MDWTEPVAWLSRGAVDELRREAQRHAPLETGGVLVGYRAAEAIVVTALVHAGPLAERRVDGFSPDAAYQASEIAKLYEASGRLDTYLGDWHSHPGGVLMLSRTDRQTIRRISHHADARCEGPVMLVVGGRGDDNAPRWDVAGWRFDPGWRPRLTPITIRVDEGESREE